MTEANRFSSVVSHNEHSTHTFECSQFGKFESKGRFTRYDLSAGRCRGGNLACILTADKRPIYGNENRPLSKKSVALQQIL